MTLRLCQRERASCGACCGLYNVEDVSRLAVRALLDARTAALAGVPRTREAFRAAGAAIARAGPAPLFPSVKVCPLLGFLDAGRTRVGCLAHPAATGGPDLRDCGAYDVATCEGFLCPSHAWLSEEEAALVEEVCADDFHLYGLVVTDVEFLRAALAAVAAETGAAVRRRHLASSSFRRALHDLLAAKEELAPGSDGLFGAFAPGPAGEPVPREIDYVALGRSRSALDALLTHAGADPRSGNDLDALEEDLRARVEACVTAFPG